MAESDTTYCRHCGELYLRNELTMQGYCKGCDALPLPKAEISSREGPLPLDVHREAAEVRKDRSQRYGPIPFNQETLGTAFTALLESHYQIKLPHPVPAHLVGLMMVAVKIVRAAAPFRYDDDDYVDAHNYLDIARHDDPRRSDYGKDINDGVQHGVRSDRSPPVDRG